MNYLAWPMGLSDAIVFADLAVKLSRGEPTIVPCLKKNETSVRSLFALHDNIEVHVADGDAERELLSDKHHVIRMGDGTGVLRNIDEDRIQWIYRSVGRDPAERFSDMVVLRAAAKVEQVMDASVNNAVISQCFFLHENAEKEYLIDRSFVKREYWNGLITPVATDDMSILSWVRTMLIAGTVHCIDGPFLHLADAIQHKGALNYHRYAKPGSPYYKSLGEKWNVIEK